MELTEEQYEESSYLERELSAMQTDEKLPWHQRKMANDAIKAILNLPEFPFVYSEFYRRVMREIREALEYQELECLKHGQV